LDLKQLFSSGGVIVGVSGLILSLVTCVLIIWMGLAAGVSAIGICERTEISSGGVYSLLNRVLGGKIGAAVGTVFAFGLCVTAALYATSFATAALASADMNPTDNRWEIAGLGQVNSKTNYFPDFFAEGATLQHHIILCQP